MAHLRIAVDIGGTFTDVYVFNEHTGEASIAKTSSTPDPIDGFMAGLSESGVDLDDVTLIVHGTTVATNALITRRLPRTAMICTEGFRDVIEIRRGNRDDLWDVYKDVASPYVPRRDRLNVPERIDATGTIRKPLDEEHAREVARILRKRDVAAVAVCFMNSFMNDAHERRMKEILQHELPGVPVTTSSEVLPEIFEHERFSTTVANAALRPVAGDYCARLDERLKESGYKQDLLLLHSGGGVMTAKGAYDFPARLAGSGIAAGAIASRHIATQCGYPNSIGLDMGGTSCDVSLAYEGESRVTKDWFVEFGYPIRFPSIEVLTIGAGGGSLAWIDEAGSLRNGPQSAGSNPGPACYGKGNVVPTNTDANVVLGRLGTRLAGGQVVLDATLAEEAVRKSAAEPFGMSLHEAADAIVRLANANMADAVRLISIARGYDPRDFALVAFGGAGALHGAALAQELSIPVVIVPPNPGVTSALGCLLVDVQHDFAESFMHPAEAVDTSDLAERFAHLEAEALERLALEGVARDGIVFQRSVDMMYRGQWRSLAVPLSGDVDGIGKLIDNFHELHEREYNYRRDDAPVDIYRLNLKATGAVPKAELAVRKPTSSSLPEPVEYRSVWFDGTQPTKTPVYHRPDISAGSTFAGPAIIDQVDSTTVVPPGFKVEVDSRLNILMHLEASA
jgi:N-methylhydantoinase A